MTSATWLRMEFHPAEHQPQARQRDREHRQGALLSLLRERSGSLAAPVLLHLAANCAGALAGALAQGTGAEISDLSSERPRLS